MRRRFRPQRVPVLRGRGGQGEHHEGGRGGRWGLREEPSLTLRVGGRGGREHRLGGRHPSSSLIGLALASTSRIGRPLFSVFCLAGSIPSPLMTVANRSGTRDRTVLDLLAIHTGVADRLAAANPAAGQNGRPGVREMVAAGVLVDLRRPAEFAHPDDERAVEQPARAQIGHQSVAQPASSTPHSFSTVSKFCAWVSQPRPFVPSADESVTSTNGTPRSTSRRAEQAALAERVAAVSLVHGGRFLVQVKRLGGR